ncbi:MAG: anthranilate synthase/aminodeoxychorismate synthase-like glutamine amidotransferase [Oceanicoccus sp.]
MILLIDNYDSFTYNLVQQIESLGARVVVKTHDGITLEEIEAMNPEKIILSPGPKDPQSSGVCVPVIDRFHKRIPILGVCLGHQCLGSYFGVEIVGAKSIMHGKTSELNHGGDGLFTGLPDRMKVARYHSLALKSLPAGFKLTAWTDDDEIMAMEHESLPIYGVQFHPESFMTLEGNQLMANFLNL